MKKYTIKVHMDLEIEITEGDFPMHIVEITPNIQAPAPVEYDNDEDILDLSEFEDEIDLQDLSKFEDSLLPVPTEPPAKNCHTCYFSDKQGIPRLWLKACQTCSRTSNWLGKPKEV